MLDPAPLVDGIQTLASDSPILLGGLVALAALATIAVVRFVVGLAVRLALVGAIVLGALVAVGYLG
ncbi:hypothetical protein [Halovivax limisalsi]|uniref:hypothetical protein n=1 Tax=Halovivax limisalsi TaxID=1453760 RepID=UPI001FFD348F|nr:hypothetical protein [Halovivax limisalsi]